MNSKSLLVTSSILVVNLGTMGLPVYSYNYDSHEQLSKKIFSESKLKSQLPIMGLRNVGDQLTLYNNDDRFADMTQSVIEWLLYDTEQEDAILSSNLARSHTSINLIFHEDLNQNVHPTRMKRQNLKLSFPVNILIQTFFYLSLRRIS